MAEPFLDGCGLISEAHFYALPLLTAEMPHDTIDHELPQQIIAPDFSSAIEIATPTAADNTFQAIIYCCRTTFLMKTAMARRERRIGHMREIWLDSRLSFSLPHHYTFGMHARGLYQVRERRMAFERAALSILGPLLTTSLGPLQKRAAFASLSPLCIHRPTCLGPAPPKQLPSIVSAIRHGSPLHDATTLSLRASNFYRLYMPAISRSRA